MRHILIAAAAVAALTAAAAPASAQPYRGDRGHERGYDQGRDYGRGFVDIDAREAEIAQRIEDGERRGGLTRLEARQLRAELRSVESQEARFRHNGYNNRGPGGLSASERVALNRMLDRLSQHLNAQRHDGERRHYR